MAQIMLWILNCNKPFTLFAEVHSDLLRDSLGDVHLCTQAGYTHVGWVGRNGYTTGTAQAGQKRIKIHTPLSFVFSILDY